MTTPQTPAQTATKPLLSPLLLLFLLAMIFANLGGNMYGALLPLYLQDLGASVTQVGLFFTISQIIPLALQILGGWISDSLGRLRAIAIGSVAGIFTYVFLLIAPSWQWVLLAMAAGAITGSLIGPSFDAFIAEQSSEHNRARVFGISQALFQIVSVVGPVLGGFLAERMGFRGMLLLAGMFYLAATFIRVGMARAASRAQTGEAAPKLTLASLKSNLSTMFGMLVSGGLITWILITDGVRDISFALSFNFMPIYQQEIAGLTLTEIGILNSVFGLFTMLTVIPGGWLSDKKGERIGIMTGFVLIFVALMMFISVQNFWMFTLAWACAGSGVGLMMPAYQSLISKAVPEKLRGTAFGLFSTSLGIVSLPAPAIGALLWDKVGPWFPFAITAWVSLLSIIPVWFKFKLPEKARITEVSNDD
ncbi:MAG: MFS transporter [Anaerolineales bacterium]